MLATPVLAALRERFAGAHITYLLRAYVEDVIAGGGWHDELVRWPSGKGVARERAIFRLARELRAERYDLAILLTNSFRSALVSFISGAARRVGYARDGRSWLLTDRLSPLRENGRFVPAPILPYYIRLAEHLGCAVADRRLRLVIPPEQEAAGQTLKRHYGLDRGRPYAIVNAGAKFGASKCWPADRYAELCERLPRQFGLTPVLIGAPSEAALLERIATIAHAQVVCCTNPPTTLGALKVLVRDAALLVGNDTGPRHFGEAFNIPLVTLFGPTHQAWVATDYAAEVKLQVSVDCGPCQLPECPLDHRCMTRLSVDMVVAAIERVLGGRRTTLPLTTLPVVHAAGNGPCHRS